MKKHLIFTGNSYHNRGPSEFNLWTTDGTLAGTHEIKIKGLDPEIQSLGFLAGDYVQLGDKILFTAYDRLNGGPKHFMSDALWVTDGTSAGTFELGGDLQAGIKGAGHDYTDPDTHSLEYGLYPTNFVSFGNRVEFFGYDKSGAYGIWITDGTAKGTYELGGLGDTGIKGAYFSGLHASNFVALGDKLIFQAIDKFNHTGLWVTDATTKGTVEIGGARNAGIQGLSETSPGLLNPIAVGSKLFFGAQDSDGYQGLWTTDGTAKGTIEIGGLGNSKILGFEGSFGGAPMAVLGDRLIFGTSQLWASDGTAKGTVEVSSDPIQDFALMGQALWFTKRVTDTQTWNTHTELWTTDGTKQGTHKLFADNSSAIANAGASGLEMGEAARIGDKAVFLGTDASGQRTLWVTDGTAKGTFEIGGLNNHGVKNAYAGGLDPNNFISAGDIAYFNGDGAKGSNSFWVTDGTAMGTVELEYPKGAGTSGVSAWQETLMPSALATSFASTPTATHSGFILSGEIVDDYPIKSVELFDGAKHLGSADAAHGKWTVTKSLGKGVYEDLKIVATDAHGRTDTAHADFSLVIGAQSRDHLSGGSGRDFIEGLAGGDTLKGGKGADIFIFRSLSDSTGAGGGRDVIEDFHHAEHDRIDLNLIDAVAGKKGDQKFHFIGDHDFKHAGDLHSETAGANTLLSGDVNGDGRSDFALLLHGKISLHAGDFML